jgi:hypothetical protein
MVVQAMIDISEHANRVLNVIKAKYDLNDKSRAIEVMATQYEEELLEPEFKPEFVEELQRIRKGKFQKISSLDELLK